MGIKSIPTQTTSYRPLILHPHRNLPDVFFSFNTAANTWLGLAGLTTHGWEDFSDKSLTNAQMADPSECIHKANCHHSAISQMPPSLLDMKHLPLKWQEWSLS
jgi:hypothetical protein